MDFLLLSKASVIGLSIAAPVGPIGLLCVQRTLLNGAKTGFACGLGAVTADAIYGAIGAFGLKTATLLFTSIATPLSIFGAVFLIWIGIRFFRTHSGTKAVDLEARADYLTAFSTTMALTLANPMTIVSFVAVFSALSGNIVLSAQSATTMVLGVFIGSALWWLGLSLGVSLIKHKINQKTMGVINKLAGCLLVLIGIWQLQITLLEFSGF